MKPKVLIFDSEAPFYARELSARLPQAEYLATNDPDEAVMMAPGAKVIIGLAPFIPVPAIAAATGLDWVQALTTGIDNLLTNPDLKGVALTNCSGIHGPQMSELAILSMMALARDFPAILANQNAGLWDRRKQSLLMGKTLCIIGLGAIAETLARVARPFGMQITGVSDGRAEVPGFDRIHRRADLPRAMAEADFTVVLVPYGPATHHIVGPEAIGAMKPGGYLVNLSRGGCVDEDALLAALTEGRIGGASLDVFAQEPLPKESPFWHAPRCIVTPHIGGFSDTYHEQALPVVEARMSEYLSGGVAALTNRLDRE
ncbi:D-2-hydroxyacid dehydrogenase [Rhodobacter sp. NTK016B]|uniref:D-2-hydroxyacid dehydrogenase n=1 Tax=Rhodobacter sp. NTK016B TaxID=2759676 RepID=UPI001A8FF4A5|nr:D-2-hydroxyacid dehydrogenase [Rhodobacter sp. NTK016B]MBN8293399.1 D-2-hydroxyacid dehydrogenase [Rhodobacter sp. NTK016B]